VINDSITVEQVVNNLSGIFFYKKNTYWLRETVSDWVNVNRANFVSHNHRSQLPQINQVAMRSYTEN
jgi:dipeptidase